MHAIVYIRSMFPPYILTYPHICWPTYLLSDTLISIVSHILGHLPSESHLNSIIQIPSTPHQGPLRNKHQKTLALSVHQGRLLHQLQSALQILRLATGPDLGCPRVGRLLLPCTWWKLGEAAGEAVGLKDRPKRTCGFLATFRDFSDLCHVCSWPFL